MMLPPIAADRARQIAASLAGTHVLVVGDAMLDKFISCREANIGPALVSDADRPTTTKVRIVTERNQQVARIDYEADSEISGSVEQRVVSAVQQHASDAAAIVVSDY